EGNFEHIRLPVRTGSAFEAFLNGVPAGSSNLDRSGYFEYAVPAEAAATLKPGRNVLALHATRLGGKGGDQIIDAGLVAARAPDFGKPPRDDWKRGAWVV